MKNHVCKCLERLRPVLPALTLAILLVAGNRPTNAALLPMGETTDLRA
jgi:hypothetical protein